MTSMIAENEGNKSPDYVPLKLFCPKILISPR